MGSRLRPFFRTSPRCSRRPTTRYRPVGSTLIALPASATVIPGRSRISASSCSSRRPGALRRRPRFARVPLSALARAARRRRRAGSSGAPLAFVGAAAALRRRVRAARAGCRRHIDAEALGDDLKLAVLSDCGLELLQALGNALLGVTELIENRHGTLLTLRAWSDLVPRLSMRKTH